MTNSLRTRTAVVLLATVTLTAGCGGAADKIGAARSDLAGAAAAATSAEAAIAALSSKLAALTSATPVPVPSAAPTSAAAPTPSATPSAAASPSAGGLPSVPSGAALSSLLATSASPAAPTSGNLSGALASANAALGGALSQLDVTKQCAAIPLAQVQALVKAPVGPAANAPLQCGWKGTDLEVSLSPNDVGQKSYKALLSTEGHPLPGLGDAAQWFQPVNGVVPDVNSRKGSLTCYVQGVGDLPSSTMPYAGKDPFFSTKTADAQAYADKEAKLCADIFAVSKT